MRAPIFVAAFLSLALLPLATSDEKCQAENAELKQRLDRLEQLVTGLVAANGTLTSDVAKLMQDPRTKRDDALATVVERLSEQVMEVKADLGEVKDANLEQDSNIAAAGGSVYVHWGRARCGDGAVTVHGGYVAGADAWRESGASPSLLCLTDKPVEGPEYRAHMSMARIWGAEYETDENGRRQKDPVCAMCRAPHPTTATVTGTNACPEGWDLQYTGRIMASRWDGKAGTDSVCVDSAMEFRGGSEVDRPGVELWPTLTYCSGTLACPPYTPNRQLLCAVCSK